MIGLSTVIGVLGKKAVTEVAKSVVRKGLRKGLLKSGVSRTTIKSAQSVFDKGIKSATISGVKGVSIKTATRFLGKSNVDELLKIGERFSKVYGAYQSYKDLDVEQAVERYINTISRKTAKQIKNVSKAKAQGLEKQKALSKPEIERKKEIQKVRRQIRYENKRIQQLGKQGRSIQKRIAQLENNPYLDKSDARKQKQELITQYKETQKLKRKYATKNRERASELMIDDVEWEQQFSEMQLTQHKQGQVNLASSLSSMADTLNDNPSIKGELQYYSNLVLNMTGQEFAVFMEKYKTLPTALAHYLYSSEYQDDLLQYDIEEIRLLFDQWAVATGYSNKRIETGIKRQVSKENKLYNELMADTTRHTNNSRNWSYNGS